MTRINPEKPDRDAAEARMARRLCELDERRRKGIQKTEDDFLGDLTPDEITQLRDAGKCLELLDLIRPEALKDTAGDPGATATNKANSILSPKPGVQFAGDSALQTIGRYEVLGRLGAGGFGVVFLARDPQLDREVALKVLKPESIVSESARQRFLREAHAAAVLSHPAIVPIFDAGQVGPVSYIAYELCRGLTLEEWLKKQTQPLDTRLACQIMKHLAEAVQHAHSRGVIHRDLKPGNVILKSATDRQSDSSLDVSMLRVTDFGLALIESADSPSLTQTGVPLGTPAYMSPEQAQGKSNLSAASDIFSLGVIFYQLLTGQVPFKKENNVATLHAIVHDDPASPRRSNSKIDPDVSAICLKCLEKEPHKRYESCQALEDDLNRCLSGRPVQAREATAREKFWRWAQRNPALASTIAALAIVMVSATVVTTVLWLKASHARKQSDWHESVASTRAQEALRQTQRVRLAVEQLLTAIAEEPQIRSKGMEEFRRKLLTSATNFYQQLWGDAPEDKSLQHEYAATLLLLAQIHASLDEHQKAIEISDEGLGLVDEQDPADFRLHQDLLKQKAGSLLVLGRVDESIAVQQQVIERTKVLFSSHGNDPHITRELVDQWAASARAALYIKDFKTAEIMIAQAIAAVEQELSRPPELWTDDPSNFGVISAQASLMIQTDRAREGKLLAERALLMYKRTQADPHLESSLVQYELSQLHFDVGLAGSYSGDYALAQQHYDQAIGLLSELKERHPNVGRYSEQWISIRYSRALIHFFQNQFEQAETMLTQNISAIKDALEMFPDRSRVLGIHRANNLNLLYGLCRRTERSELARQHLLEAIESCEQILEQLPGDTYVTSMQGNYYGNLGFLENHLGDVAASLENYVRSLKLLQPLARQQGQGETVQFLASAYAGAAVACQRLGHYPQGIEYCESFFDDIPTTHQLSGIVNQHYIVLLAGAGRTEESLDRLQVLTHNEIGGSERFNLAKAAAQCASLPELASEADGPSPTTPLPSQPFIDAAVDLLRQAATDTDLDRSEAMEQLTTDEAFAALRSDDRFSELLEQFQE